MRQSQQLYHSPLNFNYFISEKVASRRCFDETAPTGLGVANQHHQLTANMNPLTPTSLVNMHIQQQR